MSASFTAATLAIGTEVTDGQILDRNSAWISGRLVEAGIQVIEHRAVADDHADIRRALLDLGARVDFLFVTGGLGPTSDDFTRDVLAEVYQMPLAFDEESSRQLHEKLTARGLVVRENQKRQCYFPKGARVLFNPAGTANAFAFEVKVKVGSLQVFALPGPPSEIAAIWKAHLAQDIEALIPESEREELRIFRCLGRGEGDVAELTEAAIAGSGLRVGYRAHLPYVEVKLWYKRSQKTQAQHYLDRVEQTLAAWIVNRDHEDVADRLLDRTARGPAIRIVDRATAGIFTERLLQRMREREMLETHLHLEVETAWGAASASPGHVHARLECDEERNHWMIHLKSPAGHESVVEEKPPYNYKVRSERGRKFITEKVLLLLATMLG